MTYFTASDSARVCDIAQTAPVGVGRVDFLINRPAEGVHVPVEELYFDVEQGIQGDRWRDTAWLKRPDGCPDPRVQVSLTNTQVMRCFTGPVPDSVFRCGDNLYVNLNLTVAHLPVGARLQIGSEVVLEVSDVVNDACGKFVQRFGLDAFQCVRDPKFAAFRLRGIFCSIIRSGGIHVGDTICVQ